MLSCGFLNMYNKQGLREEMKNTIQRYIKTGLAAAVLFSFTGLTVNAEEVTYSWDEDTRVPSLRRKVATAINVYTDGNSDDITHEEGVLDGVIYDILRVTPTEHTKVQVDYNEQPQYLDQLTDPETLDNGYLYAGGINAGYFSNSDSNFGMPTGAVRRNNEWTNWYEIKNTPAYGNGFVTAYINDDDLSLKYHGWASGRWNGDDSWNWRTGYSIDSEYAVSGSYTYFADGIQQDLTDGAYGDINYRTYGRAVTILAQKEDKQFLLITIYGSLDEEIIVDFLTSLDVYDAIRMDGGGSTQMVYETTLVKEIQPELINTKLSEKEMNDNTEVIGYVTVNVDSLRVRSDARTSSLARGYAENGERYQVYEITKDSNYTWYRIGDRRWIAGKEDWVVYQEIDQTDNQAEEDKEVTVKVNVDNLNIRSDASISAPIVGKAVNEKEYAASETKEAYGYTWYCIGENQWIASNEDWVSVIED